HGENSDKALVFAGPGDEVVCLLGQRLDSAASAVFDHDLEATGGAKAINRRRPEDADLGLLYVVVSNLPDFGSDPIGIEIGGMTVLEMVEHHVHRAKVGSVHRQQ